MSDTAGDARDLLAIDLGSSFVKLGWFRAAGACATEPAPSPLAIAPPALPTPDDAARIEHRGRDVDVWGAELDRWLDETTSGALRASECLIGSVHPQIAATLIKRLQPWQFANVHVLAATDLPLVIRTLEPTRVGIDRVLSAVAVNRLRDPRAAGIIVDMGTAVTVDLVAADGAFEGGAIFAGPVLALRALHAGTASLPALDLSGVAEPPLSVGKSTEQALVAGAYWGAAGAVRELVARTAEQAGGYAELFLTGGGAAGYTKIFELGGRSARYLPHLVLSGIRLVAEERRR
jgi:type III pantothenate kinase